MNPTALAPTTNQKSMLTAANMHGPCKIACPIQQTQKNTLLFILVAESQGPYKQEDTLS